VKKRSWAAAAFVATTFAVLWAERIPMGWSCRNPGVRPDELVYRCDPVTMISVGATYVLVAVLGSVLAAVIVNRRWAFVSSAAFLWLLVAAAIRSHVLFTGFGGFGHPFDMGVLLFPAAVLMTVAAAPPSTGASTGRWQFLRTPRTT
jgi:hypothetical protein